MTDPVYFVSDIMAVLACFGMTLRFCLLIHKARYQATSTRKAMVRVYAWVILLLVVLGFFISADTLNLWLDLKLNAGQFRNFGVAVTVLIVGQGLIRNFAIILADIERPAPVPVPPVVPVE